MMRKSRKSVYYYLFNPVNTPTNIENARYVIDGGLLLHSVAWESKEKFCSIFNKYAEHEKIILAHDQSYYLLDIQMNRQNRVRNLISDSLEETST
ncbi:hypothetical protein AVEN_262006-1 [Araneus ventricosus]|uniref:Uncharacterized protein n=1 Tax=Araneus ventricosus TaxID=182803 RepID=A0A4Y2QSQ4_ARAVE|nr:hypothetical protein AVEN_262006-1 [Araneus ventricosus]